MKRWLAVAFLGAALLVGSAPAAGAQSVDRRSSARFIGASIGVLRAAIAGRGRLRSEVDALIARISTGCPGSLGEVDASAVQQRTRVALGKEAIAELTLAEVAPIRVVFRRYAQVVGRLRFTRPKVSRPVAAAVRTGLMTVALDPPDLCADIETSAASGFATIPADTYVFLRAADASLFRPGPSNAKLLSLMKPYIGAAEAPALRHLNRLQHRLDVLLAEPVRAANHRFGRALSGP